jgi:aconitate hydratase
MTHAPALTSTIALDGGLPLRFIDLPSILGPDLAKLPWTMRILLENSLRHSPAQAVETCAQFRSWLRTGSSNEEIAFHPQRLMMHDTTCVPALVDMAALRESLQEMGGDPSALHPVLPVDVSVDHSVAVDAFGHSGALAINISREIERNSERYKLMKWATSAFEGVRVHSPGTGIMHTMNLEQLASVISPVNVDGQEWLVPDSLIGTDSHTPMINGIGVLAWGVGGLEAESVMFGMPVTLRIPDIIGVRLTGRLREGVLSTDLALAVTQRLRDHTMSGQFVEFFGSGVSSLSAGDRAVVANMTPEYGGASGYFPIDAQTIRYLAATGRSVAAQARVESGAKRLGLWFDPDATPQYSEVIEINLSQVDTSLAGPQRPQDRIPPGGAAAAVERLYQRPLRTSVNGEPPDGAVAIAAITSCTNTSDPRLMIAAGLLARNARRLGLRAASWVKTSLAPGSPAAGRYLIRSGLMEDLAFLGFDIVAYGCTTCIGNSGPLEKTMNAAIGEGTIGVAVLSGNRNFPGRVHPQLEAGFLASPPLVIAYALAGDINRDIRHDAIGNRPDGSPVYLAEIWPSSEEIDSFVKSATRPEDFSAAFQEAEENDAWAGLEAPAGVLFPWNPQSTYVRRPPFVTGALSSRLGTYSARPLLVLGDDITTDHISPAGQIPHKSETGSYLVAHGADPLDLNVFASRRGNWEAMVRGLFTNRSVINFIGSDLPPGTTIHAGSGDVLPLWKAATRYVEEAVPVVIVAGERYGTGSSRDWAAKGVALLGVNAVIASSFERIHRSNLIGMGILPLLLPQGRTSLSLDLTADDWISVDLSPSRILTRCLVPVQIVRPNGTKTTLECRADVQTEQEVAVLKAGGIMALILHRALFASGGKGAADIDQST